MKPARLWQSVMVRLLGIVLITALLASTGLSVLELEYARTTLRMKMTDRVLVNTRRVKYLFKTLGPDSRVIDVGLRMLQDDVPVSAVKIQTPERTFTRGKWQTGLHVDHRQIDDSPATYDSPVSLAVKTLAVSSFTIHGKLYKFSLIIDGPGAWDQIEGKWWREFFGQWLVLALVFLAGSLAFRRLVHHPLGQLKTMLDDGVHSAGLLRFAYRHSGEIRALTRAAAKSLTGWEKAARETNERLQLYESLVEQAPVAMVTLDAACVITGLNDRAARMFGASRQTELIGKRAKSLIARQDVALLEELIERAMSRSSARCQMELAASDPKRVVLVKASTKYNSEGTPQWINLVLVDVTQTATSYDEMVEYHRLLQTMLDQTPDAILLVNSDQRVAAFNDALLRLLQVRSEQISGTLYEHDTFWHALEPRDVGQFWRQLDNMARQHHQPSQELLDTSLGRFLFRCSPVQASSDGEQWAYVWMVREMAEDNEHKSVVVDHTACLKRLNAALIQVSTVDELLGKAVEQLLHVLDVEAVGVTVRSINPTNHKTHHRLHRRRALCRIESSWATLQAVERDLLPIMTDRSEAVLWPELSGEDGWATAFVSAGFTSVAAVGLPGWTRSQGMIWIAQRGGERITRQDISLLESLSPLIAAMLHAAAVKDSLRQLDS